MRTGYENGTFNQTKNLSNRIKTDATVCKSTRKEHAEDSSIESEKPFRAIKSRYGCNVVCTGNKSPTVAERYEAGKTTYGICNEAYNRESVVKGVFGESQSENFKKINQFSRNNQTQSQDDESVKMNYNSNKPSDNIDGSLKVLKNNSEENGSEKNKVLSILKIFMHSNHAL